MTTHIPSDAVVVGVDGSHESRTAIDKAAELATLEHRPLHLLHAERIPVPYPPPVQRQFGNLPSLIREASRYTANEARDYASSRFPDLTVTVSVSAEDPRRLCSGLRTWPQSLWSDPVAWGASGACFLAR